MGWLSWERFRCNLDCENFPDDCISEHLYKSMADHISTDGYLDAGYEYVIVDDCWLEKMRDDKGRLQADRQRFPNGMKALADYVHSKGLKFGIYEDFGTKTCAGYPGSEYYMQLDAQTFADWGVDYLKLDGCFNVPKMFQLGYPPMAFYIHMTGRPMLLSCEYPTYELAATIRPNYTGIAEACNLARNTKDIQDS